jgi:hypothetical protein
MAKTDVRKLIQSLGKVIMDHIYHMSSSQSQTVRIVKLQKFAETQRLVWMV